MYALGFLILLALGLVPIVAILGVRARRAGLNILRPTPGLLAAISVPMAMLFLVTIGPGEGFVILAGFMAVALLAWAWVLEFVTLMGMGDDAFPGRFDKLVWAALMIVLPPVGMIAFGVFRRAYWVAEKPAADVSMRELA